MEIVLACDLVVASTSATFGLPEVARGLVATSGALFRAARLLPVNLAREMLLTGERIDAERAHAAGLVNRLAEPGRAVAVAVELAERIVANGPVAVQATMAGGERPARRRRRTGMGGDRRGHADDRPLRGRPRGHGRLLRATTAGVDRPLTVDPRAASPIIGTG